MVAQGFEVLWRNLVERCVCFFKFNAILAAEDLAAGCELRPRECENYEAPAYWSDNLCSQLLLGTTAPGRGMRPRLSLMYWKNGRRIESYSSL